MKLRDIIELFLVPVICYGVFSLDKLNSNIAQLNVQVAVIIAQASNDRDSMKNIERRLEKIEHKSLKE